MIFFFITNEAIDLRRKSANGGFICNICFRHMIMSIETFCFQSSKKMDFGLKWIIDELNDGYPQLNFPSQPTSLIIGNEDDRTVWMDSNYGKFSINSFYSSLAWERREPFPASIAWDPQVPVSMAFFAWEIVYGRILKLDQLRRMEWDGRCAKVKKNRVIISSFIALKQEICGNQFILLFGVVAQVALFYM